MWYVYILLCEGERLYTGISNNPDKRLAAHIAGRGSRFTQMYKPLKRVYLEIIGGRALAMKREIQIKRLSKIQKKKGLETSF